MTTTKVTTRYYVSEEPDEIVRPEFSAATGLPNYRSMESAVNAIESDQHGNVGTLYVIKAELTVVATASRSWTLVQGRRPEVPE